MPENVDPSARLERRVIDAVDTYRSQVDVDSEVDMSLVLFVAHEMYRIGRGDAQMENADWLRMQSLWIGQGAKSEADEFALGGARALAAAARAISSS